MIKRAISAFRDSSPDSTKLSQGVSPAQPKLLTSADIKLENDVLEMGTCKIDVPKILSVVINSDTIEDDAIAGAVKISSLMFNQDRKWYAARHTASFDDAGFEKISQFLVSLKNSFEFKIEEMHTSNEIFEQVFPKVLNRAFGPD